MSKINSLKQRIEQGKQSIGSELTPFFDIAREFGALGDIFGRQFEVRDKEDNLVYKVVQKPMKVTLFHTLAKELGNLRRMEVEANKKAGKGNLNKGKMGGRR